MKTFIKLFTVLLVFFGINTCTLAQADFSVDLTAGVAPLTVHVTDKSSGNPTSSNGDFRDGSTSTEQNPSHTCSKIGKSTVKLTATNDKGSNTKTKTNYTTVNSGIDGGITTHTFTDPRDGKTYKIVKIGTQTWMAENLAYKTSNGCWAYNNNENNVATYGRLYNWATAKTACPSGWHLPSDKEWKTLEMYLGMSQSQADNGGWRGTDEGKKMKSTSGWKNNGNGTNSSGFNALPGGARGIDGSFDGLGSFGDWWSSSEGFDTYAWNRYLDYSDQVYRDDHDEAGGFSVRCVRDNTTSAPTAAFTATPTSGSVPLTVKFTDMSANNPASWSWDFGDGSTSTDQNPSHTYQNTGRYTVKLTVTNDLGSNTKTKSDYIMVNGSLPVAEFSANTTTGAAPLTVSFTDNSTGSPTSWSWDFGDGSTSSEQNPSHIYQNTGKYTVKLTVTNDLGSNTETKTDYITVIPAFTDPRDGKTYKTIKIGTQTWMAENLAYLPDVSPPSNESGTDPYYYVYGYNGASVSEAKATDNYATYGVLYNWPAAKAACPSGWHLPTHEEWNTLINFLGADAGDKMKETGTTHWYSPNTGATNESGFTALPGSDRDFNGSFHDLGSRGYWWSSSEALYGNAWDMELYSGDNQVTQYMITKTEGFSVRCVRDNTTSTPAAAFSADTTTGTAPLTVSFTDNSTGNPTSWNWDFGDGSTSTVQNPSHTYQNLGKYTVKLTVTYNYGSDSITKTDYITVTFTDPRDGKTYKTVKIGAQIWMAENLAYLPSVSPPSNGSRTDPVYYVSGYSGTSVSEAKATDNYTTYGVLYNWPAAKTACPTGWHLSSDEEWKTLEMYLGMSQSEADAEFDRGTDEGKKLKSTSGWNYGSNGTDEVGFSALPGGYRYYDGNFGLLGDAGYWWTSTAASSVFEWTRAVFDDDDQVNRGRYHPHIGFSVRCVRDNTTSAPVAAFSADTTTGTTPFTVTFTDNSTGNPTSWEWDFGDGAKDTVQNPVHIYQKAGSYSVSLIVGNQNGSDTLTRPAYIQVQEGVQMHFTPVWSGNPYQPMNILIDTIVIPDSGLHPNDEIGLFDTDNAGNEICVGTGIVSGTVSSQHPLTVVASADDPSTPKTDGFTSHHTVIYKLWSSASQKEYTRYVARYNPAFDSLYSPLGSSLVGISFIKMMNQKTPFSKGWNMMSLYVTPDSLGMLKVLKPLVSSGSLVKAIDEKGGFVQNIPGVGWMNTIGDMANTEGYYIKVSQNDTLQATGLPVDLPFSIPLQTGWNIMGYPVQTGQDAMAALKKLIDSSRLVKAINETGGFIQNIPGVGWMNTIGNFEPGEGYYVKVNHNTQITFNKPAKEAIVPASGNAGYAMPVSRYFNKAFSGNPYYPMNIVVTNIDLDGLSVHAGDEVAAFDKDVCVGVGVVPEDTRQPVNIVVSLDDPSTKQKDGYVPGDDMTLRYMSPKLGSPVTVTSTTLSGVSVFTPLETRVCGIAATAKSVESHLKNTQNAFRAYPNPASSSVTLLLGNKERAQVEIELMDLNGKIVRVFCNKTLPAGTQTLHYDLSGLPSGIYNVRVLRKTEKQITLNNYKLVITH